MSSSSVGIIYKHHHEPAKTEAKKLGEWFRKRDIAVFSEEMNAEGSVNGTCNESSIIPKDVDWFLS